MSGTMRRIVFVACKLKKSSVSFSSGFTSTLNSGSSRARAACWDEQIVIRQREEEIDPVVVEGRVTLRTQPPDDLLVPALATRAARGAQLHVDAYQDETERRHQGEEEPPHGGALSPSAASAARAPRGIAGGASRETRRSPPFLPRSPHAPRWSRSREPSATRRRRGTAR